MYNTAEEIIQYIGNAKKHTPVKVYVKGKNLPESDEFHIFGDGSSLILIGDIEPIQIYLEKNKARIQDTYWEHDRRNSAIPMLDITHINARIEPGAIIRDHVTIENNAVIMMGAILNLSLIHI